MSLPAKPQEIEESPTCKQCPVGCDSSCQARAASDKDDDDENNDDEHAPQNLPEMRRFSYLGDADLQGKCSPILKIHNFDKKSRSQAQDVSRGR